MQLKKGPKEFNKSKALGNKEKNFEQLWNEACDRHKEREESVENKKISDMKKNANLINTQDVIEVIKFKNTMQQKKKLESNKTKSEENER
jgi:hypothetical protein